MQTLRNLTLHEQSDLEVSLAASQGFWLTREPGGVQVAAGCDLHRSGKSRPRARVRCIFRMMVVTAACLVASLGTGCQSKRPGKAGKVVVVLADRSASTEADRNLYQRAMEKIEERLKPGDRIIAGWITATSAADFRNYLDEELPAPLPPMGIMDIPSKYQDKKKSWERNYEQQRSKIRANLKQFLGQPGPSARTRIFESLRVVGQLLASAQRSKKMLILLGDMIEDSEVANFERVRIDASFIKREIVRQRSAGVLPNLRGVRVFVVGARAEPLQRAAAIERFWRQYFAATGAVIPSGGYSRALPTFNPKFPLV